jgi:hypothetical protein
MTAHRVATSDLLLRSFPESSEHSQRDVAPLFVPCPWGCHEPASNLAG